MTWHHIPEERNPPPRKISRNEFIDPGCTEKHVGSSYDEVMDLPGMWLIFCCGFSERSKQRLMSYPYTKKNEVFAYLDVVSMRLFNKAKDKPRS